MEVSTMRSILVSTMAPILLIFTIADAFSIYELFHSYRRKRNRIALLVAILCIGLFYDSLILTLGAVLPYGGLLKGLSQLRYVLHAALIPLLLPICALALTEKEKVIKGSYILMAVISAFGLYSGFSVMTEPVTVGAIRRYAQSDLTPAFADTLTQMLNVVPVFFMMGIGIYLWIKKKNPHMFLSGFFMFLFTMLGIFLGKDPGGDPKQSLMFYISMYGESLMVFFLYLFIKKVDKESDKD